MPRFSSLAEAGRVDCCLTLLTLPLSLTHWTLPGEGTCPKSVTLMVGLAQYGVPATAGLLAPHPVLVARFLPRRVTVAGIAIGSGDLIPLSLAHCGYDPG